MGGRRPGGVDVPGRRAVSGGWRVASGVAELGLRDCGCVRQIITEVTGVREDRVAVLSGPNLARGLPAWAATLARCCRPPGALLLLHPRPNHMRMRYKPEGSLGRTGATRRLLDHGRGHRWIPFRPVLTYRRRCPGGSALADSPAPHSADRSPESECVSARGNVRRRPPFRETLTLFLRRE